MIWTDNIYNLVDDIIKMVHKNVMEPSGTDYVTKVTTQDITWQEVQEVVKLFQNKGFEATWYQNPSHIPVILITWGVPQDIDEINDMYATTIKTLKTRGDSIKKFENILAEYLSYVHYSSRKNVCVIPIKYLDYICGKDSTFFNYNVFKNVIDKLSTQHHLKVQPETFDKSGWNTDYISIQKIKRG